MWPRVAFWTVYSVSLLGTIEEAFLDLHHELESASSRAQTGHDVTVLAANHMEVLG